MAFTPFARFRNFTLNNLKALLEIYPDVSRKLKWSSVANDIEEISKGYKKTSYQQACQFGIENRGNDDFEIHNYLFALDDKGLEQYLVFWFKTYYAPNPYVNSSDKAFLLYCEFAKELLISPTLSLDFYDFFEEKIGGKSDDILLNAFKNYAAPLKYKNATKSQHIFYIDKGDEKKLIEEIRFIEKEFPIGKPNDRTEFFNRYSYSNFCKFHGIDTSIPEQPSKASDIVKTKEAHIRKRRINEQYPLDFIVYGAPGTGKTYSTAEYATAIIENRPTDFSKVGDDARKALMDKYRHYVKNGQIVFTTFHQNYGYEEFIQGLRPDSDSSNLSFRKVDGVFKTIADKAMTDDVNNYVIIIDEINRANISKVFGELITLIEEDKRWGELNQMSVTLPSGDEFAVPNNLYIIGTMNSADKSISLIDVALRRRFEFVEQKPDADLIQDKKLQSIFTKINDILGDELKSADLLIGHSYFMNKTEADLPRIMNNNIIPLLYEYYYDDKKKINKLLTEALKDTDFNVLDNKIGRLSVK